MESTKTLGRGKERENETPSGGKFHEWIYFQVAQRLPVKSIFRFKCVSRGWNCMISDPAFALSYIKRKGESFLPTWYLLYRYSNENYLEIPPGLRVASTGVVPSELTFKFVNTGMGQNLPMKVLAVGDGLLLCIHGAVLNGTHCHYYVCNPLTKQCVSIRPLPCIKYEGLVNIGFMVDPSSGVFHVVRLLPSIEPVIAMDVNIFSSDSCEWKVKKISCPFSIRTHWLDRRAVTYKGVLHWIVASSDKIIAYDPKNENDRFHKIDLPDRQNSGILGVSQGLLCYFNVADLQHVDHLQACNLSIWTLKDYDKGEWCLVCVVDIGKIWTSDYDVVYHLNSRMLPIIPLAFHPFNSKMVYLAWNGRLLTFQLFSRSLEVVCKMHPQGKLASHTVFPFVVPVWPTQINQPFWKSDPAL